MLLNVTSIEDTYRVLESYIVETGLLAQPAGFVFSGVKETEERSDRDILNYETLCRQTTSIFLEHKFKAQRRSFRGDFGGNLFTQEVVGICNSLPEEMVESDKKSSVEEAFNQAFK